MAGRGRGRGRGMSFAVETLGFGRGEALPAPTVQPPSNFPPLEFKPVSLLAGEECEYILALKQEFRGAMQESPYFLKFEAKKRDILRYSDKYQLNSQNGDDNWEPDWSFFPSELKPAKKRKMKGVTRPNITGAKKSTASKKLDSSLLENLQELEKKEQQSDGEQEDEEEAKGSGDEEVIEEDYYDEEEMEEETDYISSYFDNGEGYGMDDEDDGLDDGPVY